MRTRACSRRRLPTGWSAVQRYICLCMKCMYTYTHNYIVEMDLLVLITMITIVIVQSIDSGLYTDRTVTCSVPKTRTTHWRRTTHSGDILGCFHLRRLRRLTFARKESRGSSRRLRLTMSPLGSRTVTSLVGGNLRGTAIQTEHSRARLMRRGPSGVCVSLSVSLSLSLSLSL